VPLDYQEVRYLREWWGRAPLEVLAESLEMSPVELRFVAGELGIVEPDDPRRGLPWTAPEDAFLRRNMGVLPDLQLARALGRTRREVRRRSKKLARGS
jgi:hypothetical protein